jgi:CubicO group peptidase (beta-lactamase class C family)
MPSLTETIDSIAGHEGFAGVVRVDRDGEPALARAYGLADRANRIPNTVDTRFAIASGSKGLTALTIASLIEDGVIALTTTARSVLGRDLPLIDDAVTVEHLLAHRSGIGDYLDEEAGHDVGNYLPVPAHALATTEQFLVLLDGYPAKFAPGERFSYCNGGYVVLALIAERVAGVPFHELVKQRVCAPARMRDTAFLRSDELPGGTALGYLSPSLARGPTSSTCRSAATAMVGSIRPWPTSARSGGTSSPATSCPSAAWPRWCGPAATCRPSGATAWASGCTRQARPCDWRDTTPESPSRRCTTRERA